MSILTAGARRRGQAIDTTPYAMPTSAPWNVPQPTITPTYDGTGSALHPGVLDFRQINGGTWNGWRYWMAMTPYYNNNDTLENPSILVSSDGYTWQEPLEGMNPIYPWPGASYNSDTDIEYDPSTDELVLIYKGPGPEFNPRVARSADGVTWPAAATAFAWPNVANEQVSPALIRLPDGTWACWTNKFPTPAAISYWTAPDPLGPWSGPTACTGFHRMGWHLDVTHVGGIYYMLIFEQTSNLWAATSRDGYTWASNTTQLMTTAATGSWDSEQLYRGSMTPHENGTHFRVWYPGRLGKSWRIGYTEIPLTEWPPPPA